MNTKLQNDILDILATSGSFFQVDGGERFEAVTETDLMSALRERGWRLPPAGFFGSDIRDAGFQVQQGYEFRAKCRRSFRDGSPGRALSDYQTIIFI